jgi:hypothetical protein
VKPSFLAATWLTVGLQSSPFNLYGVHLQRSTIPGGCSVDDLDSLRNHVCRFRDAPMFPSDTPVTLRDGRYVETDPQGSIEWEMTIGTPEAIQLERTSAVLLNIGAAHLGGTGSIGYVLVARCRSTVMEILFEACGPIREARYDDAKGLTIVHYVWAPADCHACPSREVTEHYTWFASRGRFVLGGQSERALRP